MYIGAFSIMSVSEKGFLACDAAGSGRRNGVEANS